MSVNYGKVGHDFGYAPTSDGYYCKYIGGTFFKYELVTIAHEIGLTYVNGAWSKESICNEIGKSVNFTEVDWKDFEKIVKGKKWSQVLPSFRNASKNRNKINKFLRNPEVKGGNMLLARQLEKRGDVSLNRPISTSGHILATAGLDFAKDKIRENDLSGLHKFLEVSGNEYLINISFNMAVSHNRFEIADMITEHFNVNINNTDIFNTSQKVATPLIKAIEYNNFEQVRFLLNHGANPNLAVRDGDKGIFISPLTKAVKEEQINIIKLLLEHKAMIDSTNASITPLYVAVKSENIDIVKLLLNNGADANARSPAKDDATPLEAAVENNNVMIAKLLLEKGADPNAIIKSAKISIISLAKGAAEERESWMEIYELLKRYKTVNDTTWLDIGDEFEMEKQLARLNPTERELDSLLNDTYSREKEIQNSTYQDLIKTSLNLLREKIKERKDDEYGKVSKTFDYWAESIVILNTLYEKTGNEKYKELEKEYIRIGRHKGFDL